MASDWPRVSLGKARVVLIDCVHKTPPKADVGLPYLSIPQMKTGTIELRDARRMTQQHFVEWTQKAMPEPHDIVLSRRCNPGVTAAVPTGMRFALGQNLVLLRADGSQVHKPFLKWLVRSPEWWDQVGKFINVGAVFESLRCADVPKFELPLPPLPEQRRIAHVLGTLDDKIELNRKMNRTLEAMAQALFKSWFIDFDGVPQHDLVDSELGPIPKGWEVASVYEFASVTYGAPFRSKIFNEEGLGLPLIRNRDLKTQQPGKYTTEEHPNATLISPGDITVSMDAEFRPYIWAGSVSLLNQRVCTFVPEPHVSRPFVFYSIIAPLAFWERAKVGTTVIHLGKKDIDQIRVVKPPAERVHAFGEISEPLIDRLVANAQQSRTLADLRDALLPKLISGEIRVPEAEEAVEAAGA